MMKLRIQSLIQNQKKGKYVLLVLAVAVVCVTALVLALGVHRGDVTLQSAATAVQPTASADGTTTKDAAKILLKHGSDIVYYADLPNAVAAAADGDTLVMLEDVSVTSAIEIQNKSISIITKEGSTTPVTITDAVTTLTNSLFQLTSGAKLTIGGYVVCKGSANTTMSASMISVNAGATLELTDNAVLSDYSCGAPNYGGAVNVSGKDALFTMSGGTIQNCSTKGYGGAVRLDSAARFEMTKGTLTANSAASSGGAISMSSNTTLKLNGNKVTSGSKEIVISNNTATNNGAAIYVAQGATVELISEVDIKNNTATLSGTLYVEGSIASVVNSNITDNTAKQGGGIYINNNVTANVNLGDGTVIRSNKTTSNGTGVNVGGGVYNSNSLNVSGRVIITGNQNSAGIANNLYIDDDNKAITGAETLTTGSSIGVTHKDTVGVIGVIGTGSFNTAFADDTAKQTCLTYFTADAGDYGFDFNETKGELYLGYTIRYNKVYSSAVWSSANTGYQENGRMELTSVLYPGDGGHLNTFPIVSCDDYFMDTSDGGYGWFLYSDSVKDSKPNTLSSSKDTDKTYKTYANNGVIEVRPNWAELVATVESGSSSAPYAKLSDAVTAATTGSKIVLHKDCEVSGTIKINKTLTLTSESGKSYTVKRASSMASGSVIFWIVNETSASNKNARGQLTVSNVTLDGNSKMGSVIKVNGGVLKMNEGTVVKGMTYASGEVATTTTGYGAVYVMENGEVTMNDDSSIEGNTATGFGGGMYVSNDATVVMNGGTIKNNTSNGGSGIYLEKSAKFTMKGGTITGNKEPSGNSIKGAGIYAATSFTYSGTASVTNNGSSNGSHDNNIYLDNSKGDVRLLISGHLESGSVAGVTMAKPDYFTKGLGSYGNADNFTSDETQYRIGVESDEAFLGYAVKFYLPGKSWYFADDTTAPTQSVDSKTMVVVAGQSITPPTVYSNVSGKAFALWQFDVLDTSYQTFTKDTIVNAAAMANTFANDKTELIVTPLEGDANVSMSNSAGSHNYNTIEQALDDATGSGDEITVLKDIEVSDTIVVDKSVTIRADVDTKGNLYQVKYTGSDALFKVEKPTDAASDFMVQFESITLANAGEIPGALIQVDSGTVRLCSGLTLTDGIDRKADTTTKWKFNADAGALLINGGDVELTTGAVISGNTYFGRGAGVHMEGGTLWLEGGTIEKNESQYNGGGVYVGKSAKVILQSGSITDNISGAYGTNMQGGGIYTLGTLQFGTDTASDKVKVNISGNQQSGSSKVSDNIYLTENCKLDFASAVDSTVKLAVTLATPKQGVFTKGFKNNADIGQITCENVIEGSSYSVAQDADGEVYVGFAITFDISEDGASDEVASFADASGDASGDASANATKRTIVYTEGSNPDLPQVSKGKWALEGWYFDDSTLLSENTVISSDMQGKTVKPSWVGAVCHIDDVYYATLDNAMAVAKTLSQATVELLVSDTTLKSGQEITNTTTIKADSALTGVPIIRRGGAVGDSSFVMFRVSKGGTLNLQQVQLDGSGKSYNMLLVDGGTLNIEAGTVITNNANAVVRVDAEMLKTSGPGTVCLVSGTLNLKDGEIKGNKGASCAGVYVVAGQFNMTGGAIRDNQLSNAGYEEGAGVYLGSNRMKVSGTVVIADNKLYNAATQNNVYYTTGTGGIDVNGELKEGTEIGVTASTGPTGISAGTMVAVTNSLSASVLAAYNDNYIVSDVSNYEAFLDSSSSQVLLRCGHTVTFVIAAADEAAGACIVVGSSNVKEYKLDVIDSATLGSKLPQAERAERYFDGWYTADGERLDADTEIDKSMTVTALFTLGKCETPVATPQGGTIYTDEQDVVLSCATEDAVIYYTVSTLENQQVTLVTNNGTSTTSKKLDSDMEQIYHDGDVLQLTEDTVLTAYSKKDGWTSSDQTLQNYVICNVTSVRMKSDNPKSVFRGYTASFAATVKVGNASTSKAVTWSIVTDEDSDEELDSETEINEDTGVLTIGANETAKTITIRATSANPLKYDEVEIPIYNQYTVTYNKNSTSGNVTGIVGDSDSPYLEGTEVKVMANAYVYNGYVFTAWNTKADGSGTEYAPGDTFTIAEDTVLYAQWQLAIRVNKVTVTPNAVTVIQDSEYPFTATVSGTGNLTNDVVWSINGQKSELTTISENGQVHVGVDETAESFKVRAESTYDKTKWGEATVTVRTLQRYSVAYSGVGASGSMAQYEGTYVENSSITVQESAYERLGYDFLSWNTAANGKGQTVYPGDTYVVTQNVVFYAQWERNRDAIDSGSEESGEDASADAVGKTDKEYADETIALIEAIGDDVTLDSLPAITAARNSYDALTQAQKDLIDNTEYQKLLLREALYAELMGWNKASTSSGAVSTTKTKVTAGNTKTALPKGTVFRYGNYWYQITMPSLSTGKVTLLKPVSKKIKSATVAAQVYYDGVTFQVTAVSPKAFMGCSKLSSVTIGKNVKTIGKKAFYNDKKLSKVYIKSKKLKRVGKKALNGVKKTIYIKIPDNKYRTYKKMIEKSGAKTKASNYVRYRTYKKK